MPPAASPLPGPARPFPLDFGDLLLVLILSLGAGKLLGPLLSGFLLPPDKAEGTGRLLFVGAFLLLQTLVLLWACWLVTRQKHGMTWCEIGFVYPGKGWLPRAVLLGLLCIPLVWVINALMLLLLGQRFDNPQIQILAPLGLDPGSAVLMLLLLGLLVPLAEEFAFRGLLLPWLRLKLDPGAAIFTSALGFSLLHGIPQLMPALFAIGLLLGYLREKSCSLWPSIVIHAVFNSVMTALLYAAVASGRTQ